MLAAETATQYSDIAFYFKAFIALLVLVNPLEGLPIFLSGTEEVDIDQRPAMRLAIGKRAAIAITIILLLSLFLGKVLLQIFSISAGAFQIGGGAILFLIAVQMILGSGGAGFAKMAGGKITSNFALVPLAIPIMAGPGAINGAILYGTQTASFWQTLLLAVVILAVGATAYGFLRLARPLAKFLKETGIDIATRIMGLIIAAISAEMVVDGVASVFKLSIGHTGSVI